MKTINPLILAVLLSTSAMADIAWSSPLNPGEHEAVLNGVRLHYTVSGTGPVLVVHSGGPGMDARTWGDLAGIDEFTTVVVLHPRGSGLSQDAPDLPTMPRTWKRCGCTWGSTI